MPGILFIPLMTCSWSAIYDAAHIKVNKETSLHLNYIKSDAQVKGEGWGWELRAEEWWVRGEGCGMRGEGWEVRGWVSGEESEVRGKRWGVTGVLAWPLWLHLDHYLNTCGTHLGDTKLVASIDERPASDNISINLILVSVGTISYKQNRTMKLQTISTATYLFLHTWKTESLICQINLCWGWKT